MLLEEIFESSGYIPKNEKEARDPRWEMSISCDVRPQENVKQSAKFNFKLNSKGVPPLLHSNGTIKESPNFGYSIFNDRDNDLSKIIWNINWWKNYYFKIMATFDYIPVGWGKFVPKNYKGKISYIMVQSVYLDNNNGKEWRGTGLGQLIYDKAIQYSKKSGYDYFVSDFSENISDEAKHAWMRLSNRYPVEKGKGVF